jgi:nitrate/nitrite transport system ATP-binding protein
VVNTLPRSRTRHDLHKHPHYYRIRNHLIEFLVDRSRAFGISTSTHQPRNPPLIRPGLTPAEARAAETVEQRPATPPPLVAVR